MERIVGENHRADQGESGGETMLHGGIFKRPGRKPVRSPRDFFLMATFSGCVRRLGALKLPLALPHLAQDMEVS